jgi:hypothetical protein
VATESVLEAPPPRFTAEEIAAIAAELFGFAARERLGSERDQTFLIDDGAAGGVLKISNLARTQTSSTSRRRRSSTSRASTPTFPSRGCGPPTHTKAISSGLRAPARHEAA